jgi:hypothetical protein
MDSFSRPPRVIDAWFSNKPDVFASHPANESHVFADPSASNFSSIPCWHPAYSYFGGWLCSLRGRSLHGLANPINTRHKTSLEVDAQLGLLF